jgi:glycosyltransferase involved in cell wall biosynthesis
LWVIDSFAMGGAEALVPVFADAIDPARMAVRVCCLKSLHGNPIEPELRARGVDVHNVGARSLRDVSALRRLTRLAREFAPDVIHAHLTYASIWTAFISCWLRVPLVATLHVPPHEPDAPWRDRVRQRVMCALLNRRARAVVAVSSAQREEYVRAGLLDERRILVVHNGIDMSRFSTPSLECRAALRREVGSGLDRPLIAMVAVLREARKGADIALEAMTELRRLEPAPMLVVVGDGPLRQELEARSRSLGVDRVVRFLGNRRDVPDILAASDLFVFPTRRDPFPTVLLEAAAAGVPVVSTHVDGVPEIVEDCRTGLLVPPDEPGTLARAVRSLLLNDTMRLQLGQAARDRAHTHFSASAWVERLQCVYASVAGISSPTTVMTAARQESAR